MPTFKPDPIRSCLLTLVLTLATGCGGSTDSSGTGGAAGAGGGGAVGGGGSGGSGALGGGGSGGSGAVGGGGSGGGAGSCDAANPCPPDSMCGYPVSQACEAKGQCFPAPGAICNGYSPGCACDGSEISIVCTGLPAGYAEKPVLHAGVCEFSCGASQSCNSATEYCKVASGGPCCTEPSYSCVPIPPACSADHSCQCIQTAVGAQTCSEQDGGVTVQFMYP